MIYVFANSFHQHNIVKQCQKSILITWEKCEFGVCDMRVEICSLAFDYDELRNRWQFKWHTESNV